ncbi:glycosyltransferase family 4 protein [Methanobrevibacter sp.]|uniref:glycosyltransferase family 4 protein n=1 Tax=Methanobrevibacter sp. TaxID=66852 RepID=UPI003866FE68
MSFSEKILSKSDMYNFYKDEYERLLEKDKQNQEIIKSQKTEINGKKKFIAKKKNEIAEKNEEIKTLKNEVIKSLKKDVAARDDTISYLNGELEEYKELCNSFMKKYNSHNMEKSEKDITDINIAYVLNSFPEHSQTFVLSELKWLVENDFNVFVFFKKDPYKHIDLDFEIESAQFSSKKQLAKLLVDYDIEFMHTHFVYPMCSKFTFPLAECLNIPFTVFAHAFDIFTKEYQKTNRVAEIGNSDLCLGIYTLSDFHKNYLVRQGVNEDKIIITKQATDYEISEFSRREDKIKNIVSISRFVEKKGLDVLIDAAKLLEDEDLSFEIYGFGDLEDDLKAQIERLDARNISIEGELNPNDVKAKLKESDLIVVPCKVAENGDMDGIPTVIFESMAVGLPVLTTSVSAIPEIIKDGENGFIIEPENPELLAEKIREIASMPDEKLYEIRCRAQSDVQDISSVDKTMKTYVDVLEKSF